MLSFPSWCMCKITVFFLCMKWCRPINRSVGAYFFWPTLYIPCVIFRCLFIHRKLHNVVKLLLFVELQILYFLCQCVRWHSQKLCVGGGQTRGSRRWRRRVGAVWGGCPSPADYGGLGERRKLPHRTLLVERKKIMFS